MKALLILLAAAWITTGANATSEGERAPGLADKRFVALVLPEVNANTMDVFIDRFAARLAQNTHAIVLLDQAGWQGRRRSRCRWEEPSTASKACVFLFYSSSHECPLLMSCLEPKKVVERVAL